MGVARPFLGQSRTEVEFSIGQSLDRRDREDVHRQVVGSGWGGASGMTSTFASEPWSVRLFMTSSTYPGGSLDFQKSQERS